MRRGLRPLERQRDAIHRRRTQPRRQRRRTATMKGRHLLVEAEGAAVPRQEGHKGTATGKHGRSSGLALGRRKTSLTGSDPDSRAVETGRPVAAAAVRLSNQTFPSKSTAGSVQGTHSEPVKALKLHCPANPPSTTEDPSSVEKGILGNQTLVRAKRRPKHQGYRDLCCRL